MNNQRIPIPMPVPEEPECDFCSSKPVVAVYDTDRQEGQLIDTPYLDVTYTSDDRWTACEGCLLLILEGDRDSLLNRAIHSLEAKYGYDPDPSARHRAAHVHTLFWTSHPRGPRPFHLHEWLASQENQR